MRRVLFTLLAVGNLTAVAATRVAAPTEPAPISKPQAAPSVVQVGTPQVSSKTETPVKEESRLKRYATLLATFTVMGAIAVRRTRPQRP